MPVEYSGIVREHAAVRNTAGLFDVSHMGEFRISGPDALKLVQHITCNDASQLSDGQAQYSAMPTEEGTVVDDLLVYRESVNDYMLVVNASNIETDFQWIRDHNAFDATVDDISTSTGLLALQGPLAEKILQPLTAIPLDSIAAFHFRRGQVSNVEAFISRTGYTGEDGFEIGFPAVHSSAIWGAILKTGTPFGLLPAGLGARNTLRLEAKLLLYGNDMDRTTNLFEADLAWIVKLRKGPFVGSEALARQKSIGVRRKLAGFEMLGPEIARDHYPVLVEGQKAGYVTSGSPSITLRKNIGLAYLPIEHSSIGAKFQVLIRNRNCDAQVVPTPFYKRRIG